MHYKNSMASVVVAICLSLSSRAVVAADVNVYGAIRVSVDSIKVGAQRNLGVSSNLSNLGIEGGHRVNDFLEGEFKVEMGMDASGETGDTTPRWRYAGLKGSWGGVRIGNLPSPFRAMGKVFDEFDETIGEYRGVLGLSAVGTPQYDRWSPNTIYYSTPKKNGLQASLSYSTAYKAGSTASGMDDNDEVMAGFNINYMLKGVDIRLAYQAHEEDDSDGVRIMVRYRLDNARVALVYETIEAAVNNPLSRDVYGFNIAYPQGDITYKAQVLLADDYEGKANSGATNINLGIFKRLDKQLMLYALFGMTQNDQNAKYTVASVGHNGDMIKATTPGEDINALSIGGEYLFEL